MGSVVDRSETEPGMHDSLSELLVANLLERTLDPEELVKLAAQDSLTQLGLCKPVLVIESCHSFIRSHLECKPSDISFCMIPLIVIDELLSAKLSDISDERAAASLIATLIELLAYDKLLEHSGNILVKLSPFFYKDILEALLAVFSGCDKPNENIISISSRLALDNPQNVMHILPVLLSQTMTYLSQTTDESLLLTLVTALGRYCDSAIEFLTANTQSNSSWITMVDLFAAHCSLAVSIFLQKVTSNSRNIEVLSVMLSNIGSIITLTEWDFLLIHLPKVLNYLVGQLKKSNSITELPVVFSLNSLLGNLARRFPLSHSDSNPTRPHSPSLIDKDDAHSQQLSRIFEDVLDSVLNCLWNHLFSLYRRPTSPGNRDVSSISDKSCNEIKRAFALLCSSYPSQILQCTLSHLHSASDCSRSVPLDVLRHIITSCDRTCFTEDQRQLILTNLVQLLICSPTISASRRRGVPKANLMGTIVQASPLGPDDHPFSVGNLASGEHLPPAVRYELAKLIITIADFGYLHLGGKQYVFVEFVVRQCAILTPSPDKAIPGSTTQSDVRNLCVHILKLGSTTVPAMQRILWPYLMEFLLVPECTEAVGVICDSVVNILSKPLAASDLDNLDDRLIDPMELRFCDKFPSVHRLLARLLVLLGWPMHGNIRGLPILRILRSLSSFFYPTLPAFWGAVLPPMILYLNQCQVPSSDTPADCSTTGQSFNQEHWEELTLKMLSKSIEQVGDESWTLALLHALQRQVLFYENTPTDKSFLFKCVSVLLLKVREQHIVTESVNFIFSSVNHDVTMEQEGCANALGRICITHSHVVYEVLSTQLGILNDHLPATFKSKKTLPLTIGPASSTTGMRQFPGLFRYSSGSLRLSSPTSSLKKPTDSNFKGSLDQVKVTILWSYALTLHHLSADVLVQQVEYLVETVIGSIAMNSHIPARCLHVASLGLIGHIALAIRTRLQPDDESFVSDFSIQLVSKLLYHVVSILRSVTNVSESEATDPPDTSSIIAFPSLPFTVCSSSTGELTSDGVLYAALLAATDVIHLSVATDEDLDANELLQLTSVAIFSLPVCQEDNERLSSPSDTMNGPSCLNSSSIFQSLLLDNHSVSNIADYGRCYSPLQRLWTTLIGIYFSDSLLSTMYKVLIPHLHDSSSHVALRSLRLLNAVLVAVLSELQTVSKLGSSPSLLGQLAAHLVVCLGNIILRKYAERALVTLLKILRLSQEDIVVENLDGVSNTKDVQLTVSHSTELLICELAYSIPKSHLDDLLELTYAGLVCPTLASANTEIVPLEDFEIEDHADNSNALKSMWRVNENDASDPPSLVTPKDNAALHDLRSLIYRLKIPPSPQGCLVRLYLGVIHRWNAELTNQQVSSILHSLHNVLPQISDTFLRAALLQSVAELGNQWPILCLNIISQNMLPLDDAWRSLLAAFAFIPSCGPSMNIGCANTNVSPQISPTHRSVSPIHPLASTTTELDSSAKKPVFLNLLAHILDSLGCCHPYEQRHIPIDPPSSASKRSPPISLSDGSTLLEANFATHFWLSLVNCLQVLSYPVRTEDLLGRNYEQTSILASVDPQSSGLRNKLRTKLFGRLERAGSTAVPVLPINAAHSSSPLCDYFAESTLFCRILGHWILACTTATICRTLSGKSYEIRSGAEANLQFGVKPVSIALDGLLRFVEACNLSKLYDQLSSFMTETSFTSNNNTTGDTAADALEIDESHSGAVDGLKGTIDAIVSFTSESLKPRYTFGLVQFFIPHLQSTYKIRRITAVVVLISVLSHLDSLNSSWTSNSVASTTPDTLLDNLLGRLNDDAYAVRRIAISGISEIAKGARIPVDVCTSTTSPLQSVTKHYSRAALMQRRSPSIIRSLLCILNGRRPPDDSTFLLVLHAFNSIVPCSSEPQIRSLLSELCACLLPVYSAPDPQIRSEAFQLFALLSHFAWEPSCPSTVRIPSASYPSLQAESYSVFIPLALHLTDPNPKVVQVCKSTLKTVSPLLFSVESDFNDIYHASHNSSANVPSNRLVDFLHNCIRPNSKLHHGEFFNEFARLLASMQPDRAVDYTLRCSVYFNSDCPEIQCGALLFASSLIAHLSDNTTLPHPSLAPVCQDIIRLLRCSNTQVRATAVHAISRLHRFS